MINLSTTFKDRGKLLRKTGFFPKSLEVKIKLFSSFFLYLKIYITSLFEDDTILKIKIDWLFFLDSLVIDHKFDRIGIFTPRFCNYYTGKICVRQIVNTNFV